MKKILANKKLIVIAFFVIVVILFAITIYKRGNIKGYVTIDINNDTIVLGYNKKNIIKKVVGCDNKNDLMNKGVVDAISGTLKKYTDGTTIIIGLEKSDLGKEVEKYFIEKYEGIDRHILKFIYFENDYMKKYGKEKSIAKALLIDKLKIDDKSYKTKSVTEIIDYARDNNLDFNKYLKDLDQLDGYHSRD